MPPLNPATERPEPSGAWLMPREEHTVDAGVESETFSELWGLLGSLTFAALLSSPAALHVFVIVASAGVLTSLARSLRPRSAF